MAVLTLSLSSFEPKIVVNGGYILVKMVRSELGALSLEINLKVVAERNLLMKFKALHVGPMHIFDNLNEAWIYWC